MKKLHISLIVAVASTAYAAYKIQKDLETWRVYRQKHIKTEEEMRRLIYAFCIINEKVKNGEYSESTMEQILEDLEFHKIAYKP